MKLDKHHLTVRLAANDDEVKAAQRLRYRVFVEEMGAEVCPADHAAKIEQDQFDPFFDHLLLIDNTKIVGVYRLMTGDAAKAGIGFYGRHEFDLSKLVNSGRKVLELGRSCVAKEYRGGIGMHLLWDGLGEYVTQRGIEIMFGAASFQGNDVEAVAQALSYLHHNHLAPDDLRVVAKGAVAMDLIALADLDHKQARGQIPSLIKAYLRLGGFVGQGAYLDTDFNTIDVCLLMDTKRMVSKYQDFYARARKASQ